MLDGGQMKCSCKGWGCKICNASNQLVAFHNELMKFWLSKEKLKENLAVVKNNLNKIDSFTLYEYLSWAIDEEKFNEAVESYKPSNRFKTNPKKSEVADFKPTANPDSHHKFPGRWAWMRCQYCNGIRKYCEKENCPMWIENQKEKWEETIGSTVAEN